MWSLKAARNRVIAIDAFKVTEIIDTQPNGKRDSEWNHLIEMCAIFITSRADFFPVVFLRHSACISSMIEYISKQDSS